MESAIELYAHELEELGRAPATIGRRLSTLAGFYRYAAEEGFLEHSPAVHVRRPRIDYESHAVGLDRNELGAFLVAAGLSSPRDRALCSLLALNGLRISKALGANIERPCRCTIGHNRTPDGTSVWEDDLERLDREEGRTRPEDWSGDD